MKLVKEAISFERKKDPKETLLGTYKPGKVYAWYFYKEDEPIFMMFIGLNKDTHDNIKYPLYVCEFASLRNEQVVFRYPEFNNVLTDSLEPLTKEQQDLMNRKLNHLDDEEQELIRIIKEESNLVPYV